MIRRIGLAARLAPSMLAVRSASGSSPNEIEVTGDAMNTGNDSDATVPRFAEPGLPAAETGPGRASRWIMAAGDETHAAELSSEPACRTDRAAMVALLMLSAAAG